MLLTACGGSQLANSKGSFAPQSQAHAGAASPAYAVLYRFVNDVNGSAPTAELIDVNGALYGTTSKGGSGCKNAGCGTAYTMSTSGLEKVVYRFAGHPSDGSNPLAGLHDVSGTLYGTTIHGGKSGWGTVFSIGSNGAEKVMHSFTGGSDGALPTSGLIDVNGTLYGTTSFGGGYLGGTVFSISANGKLNVLHHFNYVPDARSPLAGLVNVK
ncbi:MAG TPA: choice-of-anchor tandem repeat GloVer-containing protein, partial [Candidatus Nitrosotalea sp.]|nr:choice-of-anchor tandem repeat GloVer-containing protein [Candidatus Nitrosotalea sp.]